MSSSALAASVFFMLVQNSAEPGPAFVNTQMMPPAATYSTMKIDGFSSLDACNIAAEGVIKNQMASTKLVTRYTKADCYPYLELQDASNEQAEPEAEE